MLLESFKMSWENIINNKLRSFLTMLGIVIGVASIIALVTIIQGTSSSISDQFSSLGANKIMVAAPGTELKHGLTKEDMDNIKSLSNVSGISPNISKKTTIFYNRISKDNVTLEGKNEVFFKTNISALKYGRNINIFDINDKNNVVLIGNNIAKDLFCGIDPLGEKITISGIAYTIIGILSSSSSNFSAGSSNDSVMIPYTNAMKLLGVKNITALDVFLKNTDLADDSVTKIRGVLDASFNYSSNAYSVLNMGDVIESFKTMMSIMSTLLAGVAAISLVVGGIGIMNMMLVSITERTKEIGLRKALGAKPSTIQIQFILESVFLSLIGGVIGMILGSLIAFLAAKIIEIRFELGISTLLLSTLFSSLVGVIFGYMPARRASLLNPIDALRSL
ncbi:MAG: ABC transporter permease [Oscillospiraceae bacterium]|nr:ABC transporter permease [Oscillospiraceae bacterium]